METSDWMLNKRNREFSLEDPVSKEMKFNLSGEIYKSNLKNGSRQWQWQWQLAVAVAEGSLSWKKKLNSYWICVLERLGLGR